MAADNYQIIIDFLLKTKVDKSQISTVANELNRLLDVHTDIDVDNAEARKAVNEILHNVDDLDEIMSALGIELDAEEAEDSLKKLDKLLEDMLEGIEDFDLNKIEKVFEKMSGEELEQAVSLIKQFYDNFDNQKAQKEMHKLANEFDQTKREAEELLATQKKAAAQMIMTGKKGSAEWDNLQKEIAETEKIVDELNDALGEMDKISDETFVDIAHKFEAIANLGGKLGEFKEKGVEAKHALKEIKAMAALTSEELEILGGIAERIMDPHIEALGTLEKSIKVIGTARSALGDAFAPEELEKFTLGAAKLGQVFGKDVNEIIQKARPLVKNFEGDAEKMLGALTYGLQNAGSASDDFLDTMDEYSKHAADAGYNTEEWVGVLTKGMEQNIRNTDYLADAIKEANIRLFEGDITRELLDSATMFGDRLPKELNKTLLEITRAGELGKKTVKEVMQGTSAEIYKAFEAGEIDEVILKKLTRAISGTPAEEVGGLVWAKVFSAEVDTTEFENKFRLAAAQVDEAVGSVTVFENLEKQFELISTKASLFFAPLIAGADEVLVTIGELGPALLVIQNVNFKGAITSITSMIGKIKAMNLAMLANPWTIALGSIIAVVGGLKLLSDAMHVTAEERQKEVEAQKEAVNHQIDYVKAQKAQIAANHEMIESYETLVEKGVSRSEQEHKKLDDALLELARRYPGVIKDTKDYEGSLEALSEATKKEIAELKNFDQELLKLKGAELKLDIEIRKLDIGKAKENMEDELTDAIIDATTGAAAAAGTSGAGFMIMETIGEWFGTSASRKAAESALKPFTDAIYNASDSKQLQEAGRKLMGAIIVDEQFTKDPKIKNKLIESTQQMIEAQADVIEKRQKALSEKLVFHLEMVAEEGDLTDEKIAEIAKTYGKTVEEAKALLEEQKKQTEEAERTAEAVKSIGKAFSEDLKLAQDSINQGILEESALRRNLNEAKKKGEDTTELKKALDLQIQKNRNLDKERDFLEGIYETTRKRYEEEEKKGKTLYEVALMIYNLEKQRIDNDLASKEIEVERTRLMQEREESVFDELVSNKNNLDALKKTKSELETLLKVQLTRKEIEAGVKEQLAQQYVEINNQIKEAENRELELTIKAKLEAIELQEALHEFEKEQIQFKIDIGLSAPSDMVAFIEDELEDVHNKLADKEKKLTEKEKLELHKLEMKLQQELRDKKQKIYEKQLDDLAKHHDKELLKINDRYDQEATRLSAYYDTINSLVIKKYDESRDSALDALDKEEEAKLKRIEDFADMQLLAKSGMEKQKLQIEQEFNKRREEIEDEHRRKTLVAEAVKHGAEVELQREKDQEILKSEQANLKKRFEILDQFIYDKIQSGTEVSEEELIEHKNLQKQLEDAEKLLEQKGTTLGVLATELSGGVTEAISGLFRGDPEAIKDSAREYFATVAGIIEKKLEAFVISLLLNEQTIAWMTSTFGIFAPAAILGAKVLISEIVHAITDPILSSILSFRTGTSGPLTKPTLSIIGDAEIAERVLRDDQLMVLTQKIILDFAGKILPPLLKEMITGQDDISKQLVDQQLVNEKLFIRKIDEYDRRIFNRYEEFNEIAWNKTTINAVEQVTAPKDSMMHDLVMKMSEKLDQVDAQSQATKTEVTHIREKNIETNNNLLSAIHGDIKILIKAVSNQKLLSKTKGRDFLVMLKSEEQHQKKGSK